MVNFVGLEEMIIFRKIRKKVLSGSKNQIIDNQKNKRTLNLILPAYSSIKMNSIANIDYTMLKAELHCDFYFTINVTGLEKKLIKFIKGNVVAFINNNEPIELKEEDDDVDVDLLLGDNDGVIGIKGLQITMERAVNRAAGSAHIPRYKH